MTKSEIIGASTLGILALTLAIIYFVFASRDRNEAYIRAHYFCPPSHELYLTRSGKRFCARQPIFQP